MAKFIKERNPEEELKKAFRMYDDDDGGTISFENLRKVADYFGSDAEDHEIYSMLKMADRRNDGENVDFEDFMRVMKMAGLLTPPIPSAPLNFGRDESLQKGGVETVFNVSWDEPAEMGNTPIIDYRIEYCINNAPWKEYKAKIKTTFLEMTNLEPENLYKFRVQAIN